MSVQVTNSGGKDLKLTSISIDPEKTLVNYYPSNYNVDGFDKVTVTPVKIENVISTATYTTDA